jgi:hypothetical protein
MHPVGGEGDGIKPHVTGLCGDAVEEDPGPVSGPKACQLRATGCIEGATDDCGQLSKPGEEAICGRWAELYF